MTVVTRIGASERFWAKVYKDGPIVTRTVVWPRSAPEPPGTPCWLWTASRNGAGYGQFFVDGRGILAHRWAYEQEHGLIPEGKHLDHLCRTSNCVRPSHLEAVTPNENRRRGSRSYRVPNPRYVAPPDDAKPPQRGGDRPRTRVINHTQPFPPEVDEYLEEMLSVPTWLRSYLRLREQVAGECDLTARDLNKIFGRGESRDERTARYEKMASHGLISYRSAWYGANRQMTSIRINEITAEDFKGLLDEVSNTTSEVVTFARHYEKLYRQHTRSDYEITSKDRGLSRRLCAEYPLPRLTAMLENWFQLREGLRPDFMLSTFFKMRSQLAVWAQEERLAARYELKSQPKSPKTRVPSPEAIEESDREQREKAKRNRRGIAPGQAFRG